LLRHFNIERSIAQRLLAAERGERKRIYQTMYDELFAAVPDHPRLTRRADASLTERINRIKAKLLRPFTRDDAIFLEFGSGDCRFSFAMAERFREVHAVDIADQIGRGFTPTGNFNLTVYDGYDLALPDGSIDVAFSDQLIEHLHPEDTGHHFKLVHRLLKPGGSYLFRTPHRLTGPHDVSRYFSEEARCFHLKEWTYGELAALISGLGYSSISTYWFGKGILVRIPLLLFRLVERVFAHSPVWFRRNLLPYLLPGVVIAATK
jgi:SAM-dependent methyltransferase